MSARVVLKSHPLTLGLLCCGPHPYSSNYTTTGVCDVTQGKLQVCCSTHLLAYSTHTHAHKVSTAAFAVTSTSSHARRDPIRVPMDGYHASIPRQGPSFPFPISPPLARREV